MSKTTPFITTVQTGIYIAAWGIMEQEKSWASIWLGQLQENWPEEIDPLLREWPRGLSRGIQAKREKEAVTKQRIAPEC